MSDWLGSEGRCPKRFELTTTPSRRHTGSFLRAWCRDTVGVYYPGCENVDPLVADPRPQPRVSRFSAPQRCGNRYPHVLKKRERLGSFFKGRPTLGDDNQFIGLLTDTKSVSWNKKCGVSNRPRPNPTGLGSSSSGYQINKLGPARWGLETAGARPANERSRQTRVGLIDKFD